MGAGTKRLISDEYERREVANVRNRRLWVDAIIGGPVVIADPITVVQPTHDLLNCNANIQIGDVDVAAGNPVPVSDAGGSLTVDQATHDNLNCNATLQVNDVDAGTQANPVRVTEVGPGTNRPNFYWNFLGFDLPSMIPLDPITLLGPGAYVSNIGNAWRTGPARNAITQLFSAQVFNNVTTSANSGSVNVQNYRYLVVFIDLAVANAPTDIRLIAQFDRGGGNWFDWTIDQWVDLRYVPGQMPLTELLPLNHVPSRTFRLRAVAAGTTAVDTFTLSAWVEAIS